MKIIFNSIGIIHSPFTKLADMPIQPAGSKGIQGNIEVFPEYEQALQDLDGFSHLYAIYQFHKASGWKEKVIPFLDDQERGLFATRAPKRPNPIGLSVLKIIAVKRNIITIDNVDILDNTPLLDIKPYIPQFEPVENLRIGWLREHIGDVETRKSDQRFIE